MENEHRKYRRALERVGHEKSFYQSIFSYVLVVGALARLNYWLDQFRNPWVLWVAVFWGLGILLQGFRLFGRLPFLGKDWEARKIREYMDKDREAGE